MIPGHRPRPGWPEQGAITFEDVSMKYRDDLPPVLKNVSFKAKPGEKIGICGRVCVHLSGIVCSDLNLAFFYAFSW